MCVITHLIITFYLQNLFFACLSKQVVFQGQKMLQCQTAHSVCMCSILRTQFATSQVVWLALFLLIKLSEHSVLVFWCACEACRHSSVFISCSLPAETTVHESQATHFPQLYLGLPLCVCVYTCSSVFLLSVFHLIVGVLDDSIKCWHQ